jgi:hypothetical protein
MKEGKRVGEKGKKEQCSRSVGPGAANGCAALTLPDQRLHTNAHFFSKLFMPDC